jgi:hypothetical protein
MKVKKVVEKSKYPAGYRTLTAAIRDETYYALKGFVADLTIKEQRLVHIADIVDSAIASYVEQVNGGNK